MAKKPKLGSAKPRLGSKPLTRFATKADEVFVLAEKLGIELMPWQKHVLIEGLRINKKGEFIRKQVGVVVSRQNGKSALMRLRLLAGVLLWGEVWIAMAQTLKQAENQWQEAIDQVQNHPELQSLISRIIQANGRQMLQTTSGGKWIIVAANKDSARGFTGNLWTDELRDIDETAWAASLPVVTAYKNSQVWVTSNAGHDGSVVLNDLRNAALKFDDDSFGWFEWSADPMLDVSDKSGWYQANPALGHMIDESFIASQLKNGKVEKFMTEHLCQWVRNDESPWVHKSWEDCEEPGLQLQPDRRTFMAFDVSIDRKRCDLVGSQVLDDGRIAIGIMQTWISETTLDDVKIANDIAAWFRQYPTDTIGFDKWASGNIAQRLMLSRFPVKDTSGVEFAQACDETLAAMNGKRLAHSGSKELTDHFMACVKKPAADGGWRVVRRNSFTNISAACAAIMAIHHASKPETEVQIMF